MIPITTNTYGIIVPIDAYDFSLFFELNEDKFEILGTVTNEEIKIDFIKLGETSLTIKEADELLNEYDKIDFRKYLTYKGIELKQNEKILILKTV